MSVNRLLFIASDVPDIGKIIDSLLPDVRALVIQKSDTLELIKGQLSTIDLSSVASIGLIFENNTSRVPFIEYTSSELNQFLERQRINDDKNTIINNELASNIAQEEEIIEYTSTVVDEYTHLEYKNLKQPIIQPEVGQSINQEEDEVIGTIFTQSNNIFSTDLVSLFYEIQNKSQLDTIDIVSCHIKYHIQFDELKNNNIIVRYSTNISGLNGDWILESHNINLIGIYFSESIKDYTYQLGLTPPTGLQDELGTYYIIQTADDICWLMKYRTNTGSVPNLSSRYKVLNDINMGDIVYESIAQDTALDDRFTGIFDGNNKTITINSVNTTSKFYGFFGAIGLLDTNRVGTLKDLNLIYTASSFTAEAARNFIYFGLLCGTQRSGYINNCQVSCNTSSNNITLNISNTITTINRQTEVGLLMGRCQGYSELTNCNLNIIKPVSVIVSGPMPLAVGGVIGAINMGNGYPSLINNITANLNDITVQYRYTVLLPSIYWYHFGGFTGTITSAAAGQCVVQNCNITYNNINIIDSQSPSQPSSNLGLIAGGCVGQIDRNVLFNRITINGNNINVSNTIAKMYYMGGGFGHITVFNVNITGTISNVSINLNNITASIIPIVNHYVIFGGLSGYIYNSGDRELNIQNCICNFNNINISLLSNSIIPSGSNGGMHYLGGLIGYIQGTQIVCNYIEFKTNSIIFNKTIAESTPYCSGGCAYSIATNTTISNTKIDINELTIMNTTPPTQSRISTKAYYSGFAAYITKITCISNELSIRNFVINSDFHETVYFGLMAGYIYLDNNISLNNINIKNISYLGITSKNTSSDNNVARNQSAYIPGGLFFGIIDNFTNPLLRTTITNNVIIVDSFNYSLQTSIPLHNSSFGSDFSTTGTFSGFCDFTNNDILMNKMNIDMYTIGSPQISLGIGYMYTSVATAYNIQNCNFLFKDVIIKHKSLGRWSSGFGGIMSNFSSQFAGVLKNININTDKLMIDLDTPGTKTIGLFIPSLSQFGGANNTIIQNCKLNYNEIEIDTEYTNTINTGTNRTIISGLWPGMSEWFINAINIDNIKDNVVSIVSKFSIINLDLLSLTVSVDFPFQMNNTLLNNTNITLLGGKELIFTYLIPFSNRELNSKLTLSNTSYTLDTLAKSVNSNYHNYVFNFNNLYITALPDAPVMLVRDRLLDVNVENPNAQNTNFDNENLVKIQSGATLVGDVNNFYRAAATGQLRPNAPPIFKTYQQMMDWKQRQNRR